MVLTSPFLPVAVQITVFFSSEPTPVIWTPEGFHVPRLFHVFDLTPEKRGGEIINVRRHTDRTSPRRLAGRAVRRPAPSASPRTAAHAPNRARSAPMAQRWLARLDGSIVCLTRRPSQRPPTCGDSNPPAVAVEARQLRGSARLTLALRAVPRRVGAAGRQRRPALTSRW